MQKLFKNMIRIAILFTLTIILSTTFFPHRAIALLGVSTDAIFEHIAVTNGTFDVVTKTTIEQDVRIGKAIVGLPPGETGVIDLISIEGPKGLEFSCKNLKVKDGIDLIESCGGPAYLAAGKTTYSAKGSNFGPSPNVTLSVNLIP